MNGTVFINLTDLRNAYTSIYDNYTDNDICPQWAPINHIYFQLANVFLFLSYLAPNGIYGILYLRITLAIGCLFFTLWGYLILCAFDTIVWNFVFALINLTHAVVICYYLRPMRFSKDIEQVYKSLFEPLKVSRHQFKKALGCMKHIKQLKFQDIYAQEKVTRVDSLSLVLSGRLVISQNGRALHIVCENQFIDSPEWFGVSTDEFFQVSATAIEDARVLIWHRDKLKLTIMGDQFLQAVFDHILGRDVVKKLMQLPIRLIVCLLFTNCLGVFSGTFYCELMMVVRGDSAELRRMIRRLQYRPSSGSPLLHAFHLLVPQIEKVGWPQINLTGIATLT